MMKKIRVAVLALAVVSGLAFTPPVFGENISEWFKEIDVNGFVSTAYTYNFNRPSDSMNAIRIFDTDDNSLKLDVAELVFQKATEEPGSVGFRLDLNYGFSIPEVEHSSGAAQSDDFDLQQAFVSYRAPLGNGLQLDFGKFITHMGLEVIEGYDGWNYNYSRSILFGFAIPFTHTGVRASYGFNDMVSAMVMVANGWDNVTDNNNAKTVGVQLGVNPLKEVSLMLNYVGGPEQDNNDRNWRHVFDAVLLVTLTDRLEFQFNSDYGREEMDPLKSVTWWGAAGGIRYAFTDFCSLNLRGEYFDDNDASRTGTSQELWEITLTPELKISEHLIVRPEYRHDDSTAAFFNDHGKSDSTQDTIAVNGIFYF